MRAIHLLMALVVVSGCSSILPASREDPRIEPPDISVDGRVVHLRGTTDLPDGARIDLTMVPGAGSGGRVFSSSVVDKGAYSARFDLTGWPAGSHAVWVEFWPGRNQQAAIVEKYGADGSGMTGGRVRTDPDLPGWEWFGAYDVTLK